MAQDDFEESLVQAVLEENPPEERGIREEWKDHVGWHRKENIFLRGGGGGDRVSEGRRQMQHKIISDSSIPEPNIIIDEDKLDTKYHPNDEYEHKNSSSNILSIETIKNWKNLFLSSGITCYCLFRVFVWKRQNNNASIEQTRRIGKRRTN